MTKSRTNNKEVGKDRYSTSQALSGWYARICIEVELGLPAKKLVYIGEHKQEIVYEGSDIFYNICGVLGHNVEIHSQKEKNELSDRVKKLAQLEHQQSKETGKAVQNEEEQWKIVSFP